MAQPEPIAMPRMPKYQPQVDIDPDDPDNYMILVPANINKKWPMSQLVCVSLAILFAIISLSVDEMSDGDILLSDGSEIDYDCGWKTLRVNIQGLSQSVDYDGDYCTNEDEVIDDEFCSTSAKNGRIWIGTSIIGILLLSASIPVILSKHKKIGGKDSWIFFAICIAGGLFLNIATFYWFFNDKCEDIEQYNNSDTNEEAQFDTSPGPSLYLMGIASFFSIAVTLINVLHICNKVDKQNFGHQSNSSQIPEQPRIQTHIVTATTINHN